MQEIFRGEVSWCLGVYDILSNDSMKRKMERNRDKKQMW